MILLDKQVRANGTSFWKFFKTRDYEKVKKYLKKNYTKNSTH